MRLQTFLSRNGVCSRRKAMALVMDGHVTVNGKVTREPSTPIEPMKDKVCVDHRQVGCKDYVYILLNKPKGYVTTRADPFAQKTVLDLLPAPFKHLAPVGRLDKDTEGLLLLTNDGDAAYKLTHPKFDVDKTYQVKVDGVLAPEDQARIEKGLWIDGKRTAPAKIRRVCPRQGQTEFEMTIHEGRKRQIRLMCAQIGKGVVYLRRIAQGPLHLGMLKTAAWRHLSPSEIDRIKKV